MAKLSDFKERNDLGHVAQDARPGAYYVTVMDGDRVGFLAGPFPFHKQALDLVERTRDEACQVDARGFWYAYGTSRLESGCGPGLLNDRLGLPTEVAMAWNQERLAEALKLVDRYTSGTYSLWNLAGPHNAQRRQEVMQTLLGKAKVPQKAAGMFVLTQTLYQACDVQAACPAAMEAAFVKFCEERLGAK